VNITPDPGEIVQEESEEYTARPVDVSVCGPVQTRELPAGGYPGYGTTVVGASVGVRLLSLEPRRKYATLVCVDSDLWISSSQAGAQSGASGAMRIPALVPYVVGHMHEVWACTVSGTANVGFETVNWSE
jgi:hypothetical protein